MHGEQDVPHDAVLVSDWQIPLQLCVPAGQTPMQALFIGMHMPLHSFIVEGHAGLHARPSQVTVPPVGVWQAVVHSVGPQVARAWLLTQVPAPAPHR